MEGAAIDKARRKINRDMRVFCGESGFGRVEQPELRYAAVYFFRVDGVHLSHYGMEIYLIYK